MLADFEKRDKISEYFWWLGCFERFAKRLICYFVVGNLLVSQCYKIVELLFDTMHTA